MSYRKSGTFIFMVKLLCLPIVGSVNGNLQENIALNKHATQSSILTFPGTGDVWSASNAVDGNKDCTNVDKDHFSGTAPEQVPWWQVDLGNIYSLSTINVYGRHEERPVQLKGFQVYLLTSENSKEKQHIYNNTNYANGGVFTIPVQQNVSGRYVRIEMPGTYRTDKTGPLLVCEVEVYSRVECPLSKYSYNCNKTCTTCTQMKCTYTDGECLNGCIPGYKPTDRYCHTECDSRSFGKNCTHTCHCINQTNCDNVNGHCEKQECEPGWKGASCDTKCDSRSFGKNCSHTCHCINQTNCDNVNGHCEKQECDPGWKGASCETKCDSRSFGKDCSHTCHCINQSNCDNVNGHCEKQECDPGWKGASCDTECQSGYFGKNCNHICHCINQTNCDNVNGHCEEQECDPGWRGASCETICTTGRFGLGCSKQCNCINNTACSHTDGKCFIPECKPGWTGDACDKRNEYNNILYRLRNEIKTSMSTVAGNWTSDRAVDGNTGPDPNKCQCCSGTTNAPLSWWMVDFGERVPIIGIAIYSRNNEYDNRQLQGFQVILSAGTSYNASAFMSKSLGMFSKMYVIKLKDILTRYLKIQRPGILTLCEVKVFQGVCEQGKFGHECSRECHCGDNKPCNQLTGSCQSSACKPGWQGPSCNETCPPETFGDNCSDSCYCAEGTCTNNYGICLGRCRQGYHGAHCNQVGSGVKSDTAVLLGVVGGGGAFLVGAVIIGIVVLKLRRRNRESVKSEYETPNRRASQTEIQEYDTIGNVTDSPAYENETATGL